MKARNLLAVIALLTLVSYAVHIDTFAYAASTKQKAQTKSSFDDLTKDPKFVKNMLDYMKNHHDFTQSVVTSMLKEPMLRLQIIGHMTENKDAMKQMTEMIKSGASPVKMDHSKMSGMKMNNSKSSAK